MIRSKGLKVQSRSELLSFPNYLIMTQSVLDSETSSPQFKLNHLGKHLMVLSGNDSIKVKFNLIIQ